MIGEQDGGKKNSIVVSYIIITTQPRTVGPRRHFRFLDQRPRWEILPIQARQTSSQTLIQGSPVPTREYTTSHSDGVRDVFIRECGHEEAKSQGCCDSESHMMLPEFPGAESREQARARLERIVHMQKSCWGIFF